jgi:hypothetical protein
MSGAPRRFDETVDQIVTKIPRVSGNAELVADLYYLRIDSWFQPPESTLYWIKLRDVLEQRIGEPSEQWHHDMIEVVQTWGR